MKTTFIPSVSTPKNGKIYTRQIAFFAAFILPMGKLLETPSILSQYAKGDILLPALMQFLVQSLVLLGVLYAASKSEKSLLERLQEKLGAWSIPLFVLFGLYYLFAAFLPLLDMEKFVYAAFFDTAPTAFSFGIFFLLLGFVCTKGIKSLGRCADLCIFLFLAPFLILVGMAFFETDLTRLFPFFGTDFRGVSQAFIRTTPHFSDVALLLPLILSKPYEKGEGVKITLGYWAGAFLTLLFFAVFFGIYSTIAPREHYALAKIAQYFPALDIVGRLDLIFVYLLTAVLLFYACAPLLYATEIAARLFHTQKKTLFAVVISICAFLAVFLWNKRYNFFYAFISVKLVPVFWVVANLLPLCLLLLPKEVDHA